MELNRILLRRFRNGEIAIAIRTQFDWLFLMDFLEREGDIKWYDKGIGLRPTEVDLWDNLKSDSAITFGHFEDFLGYSSAWVFEQAGLKIIECEEMFEAKMPFVDKIEFMHERMQDGKEFLAGERECVFLNRNLYDASSGFRLSGNESANIMRYNLSLIKKFELTEAEIVILENVYESFNYLARNKSGGLFLHKIKPKKGEPIWLSKESWMRLPFDHLFPYIKWEDNLAFDFRKYLEEL